MTAPGDHLDVLDPRFPIRLTAKACISRAILLVWDGSDPSFVIDETARTIEQETRREERFVTPAPQPRFVPEMAHEDTSVDGIPAIPGDAFDRGFARWDLALHEEQETAAQAIILDATHTDPRARRRRRLRRAAVRRLGGGRA